MSETTSEQYEPTPDAIRLLRIIADLESLRDVDMKPYAAKLWEELSLPENTKLKDNYACLMLQLEMANYIVLDPEVKTNLTNLCIEYNIHRLLNVELVKSPYVEQRLADAKRRAESVKAQPQ